MQRKPLFKRSSGQALVRRIEGALLELHCAVAKERSVPYCLNLWSYFIRIRDNGRCVVCRSRRDIVAHHIVRKSFLIEARFQTGNGITLCRVCHRQPHEIFNRRPILICQSMLKVARTSIS